MALRQVARVDTWERWAMINVFTAMGLENAKRRLLKAKIPWVIFCCAPTLVFLLALLSLKLNPFHWVPLWSDEMWWYSQIDAVVNHGRPLGYFGCNEMHAQIGTFGFWGGGMVYAMSFFGKIFGWHHWSPLFMNVFYMTFANVVFLVLARPKWRVALTLAFLDCILFVNMMYMFTGMSECTRFSMAIVLAGVFYFLLNEENRNRKSYLLVLGLIAPVTLVFFANCYILFSFLFPVYGYVLLKYWNPKRCRACISVLLCVLIPAFVAYGCMFIAQKTSAPYPSPIPDYFHQPDIASFFKLLLHTVNENYKCANLSFVVNNAQKDCGCPSNYLFFYYFLTGVALFNLVVKWKRSNGVHPLDVLVAYALLAFVGGFLALYSTKSSWTYVRGLNVALVFSMYIICMLDWRKITPILFCLAFMQLFPFVSVMRGDTSIRRQPSSWYGGGYEMFQKYSSVFSKKMHLSPTADNWENTYAQYGRLYNFYSMAPAGFGQNCIFNNRPVSKPRYIIAGKGARTVFRGYQKTYSDELISIFEKEPVKKEMEK